MEKTDIEALQRRVGQLVAENMRLGEELARLKAAAPRPAKELEAEWTTQAVADARAFVADEVQRLKDRVAQLEAPKPHECFEEGATVGAQWMREQAALCADGLDHGDCHDPECNCDGGTLAAEIRALPDEPEGGGW
jgi:regulator of replication initiation timing